MRKADFVSFRELCSDRRGSEYSTHGLHSYPAQLIPQIPRYFLQEINRKNEESTVLDPFCGTGTVMVEAMHNGWNSVGVEINPVAALIAKVKTTAIRKEILKEELDSIASLFDELNEDEVELPEFHNRDYWFSKGNIRTLAKIRHCISSISDRDVADFYKMVFSSTIKAASNADPRIYVPVLPKPEYEEDVPDPWPLFVAKARKSIESLVEFSKMISNTKASCDIHCEDIRDFDVDVPDVDLVISSPPYISAQRYIRSTRLEAYWLDYDKNEQLETNKKSIGTERVSKRYYAEMHRTGLRDLDRILRKIYTKNRERAGIASKYFVEMKAVLRKIFAILSPKGILILVVGSNTVANYRLKTFKFLMNMCEDIGFSVERIMMDRISSRGLMTRRNKTAGMIDCEWVIQMRKT